jgi:predicted  nucleic acid-binding Zn-ribbon protein
LFEHLTPDFEQPKDLINHEAAKESVKTCKVEVCFQHEDNEYSAQRLFSKGKSTVFKVYQIDGGNYKELHGPNGFINSVLPKDMAPYFFFHGEGVASISEGKESTKFRRAVRNILGFTFAEEAIGDLKAIRTEFTKRIGQLSSKQNVLKEAADRKADAEDRLEKLRTKLADTMEETKETSFKLSEVDEKLGTSGNLDAERLKREIHATESRLNSYKGTLAELNKDRQALIPKYGWAVFGSDLMDQGLDFIDESTLKGRIPAPYQDQFVKDLLENAECICGRSLGPGSDEELRVKALLETANTALLNQRVMKARSVAANLKGRATEFLEEIREIDSKKSALDKSIGAEEVTLKELETELEGINEAEIKQLTEKRAIYKSQERDLIRMQGSLNADIGRYEEIIARSKKDLAVAGANDAAYIRLSKIQEGIEEMMKRCESRLDDYEDSARLSIAAKVNDFLDQFSRKDYRVKVSETFEFHLARTNDKVVAKSKGEKLLLNLAFVSALIEHAEARANASGEFLVQGTVAPFVVDAPFGELDDTYRKATAEFLPGRVKQIVFLLSSSHWTGTVDEAIRNRVASEYVLVSNRKGKQGEKPSDTIEIGKKKIDQSRYERPKDQTSIERV